MEKKKDVDAFVKAYQHNRKQKKRYQSKNKTLDFLALLKDDPETIYPGKKNAKSR